MSVRLGRWDGTTKTSTILAQDMLSNAASGFCRQYLDLTQSFTGGYMAFAFSNNRIPIINLHSWTPQPRHAIPWQNVADGMFDDVLRANFTDFKAMPGRNVPAYFVFHHEPENEETGKVSGDLPAGETCGTREEFKAASSHVRDLMRSILSPTDGLFGVTLMQGRFASGQWQEWVPPTYHFLGIDGYSHGTVNKNGVNTETFSAIFAPAHVAAMEAGKALLLQECGVAEDNTTMFKPNFYAEIGQVAKSWPELLGICITNTRAKEDYSIDTSSRSLAAFQALAGDPFFTGAWT